MRDIGTKIAVAGGLEFGMTDGASGNIVRLDPVQENLLPLLRQRAARRREHGLMRHLGVPEMRAEKFKIRQWQ